MVDRCVCCGEIIPEGRMVCPNCEIKGVTPLTNHDASEQAYKNGYSAGYEAGRRSVGVQKWIPVSERLPPNKTEVIVYTGTSMFSHTFWNIDVIDPPTFTHWMPLPEPPNCGADMRGEEDG